MRVRVHINVPRGSFTKPRRTGWPLISPIPVPFDYGEVIGTIAEDGDAQDAIVFGRVERGAGEGEFDVVGVVRFVDAGQIDDKLVVGAPPTPGEVRTLRAFFTVYAAIKRAAHRARGHGAPTAFLGYEPVDRSGG